jgi:hypothetical protein
MSDDIDDITDEHDDDDHDHAAPMADPVLIALQLCQLAANPKTIASAVKRLRRLDRQYADIQAKAAAVTAQVEQKQAAITEREQAIAAREVALEERETVFENQAGDVRDELRQHHARLEQTHRQLVHRIMSTAGITGNWNFDLQAPPTWQQLRRMIADLPDDLPAPSTEVSSAETVRHDWAGSEFIPDTTLTRTVRGAA